ncbi:hypothetical protein SAMN05216257_1173 [Meinhardsimonia xiamenensis]|jgi:hypothetical protein|uniref:Uncharacterized protein n=1 Tax=Meinhardsimonia xiamenensis TaxID=990712 RepID=A0A1G9HL39_9RHOB|nr:hypothetical protein SAMN05216257_1173 [Meinhardsimonia xiamenensis]
MRDRILDGFAGKTIYKDIRPLAVRRVPRDHERGRTLGAYFVAEAAA